MFAALGPVGIVIAFLEEVDADDIGLDKRFCGESRPNALTRPSCDRVQGVLKIGNLRSGLVSASESPRQGHDATFDDALSALVNLGYRPQDAKEALKRVKKSNAESIVLKDMIRESLKELARG